MFEFIRLGEYDKKIALPFILAAFLILTGYLGKFVPPANNSYYVGDLGTSFGFMLTKLIPIILRYKTKNTISKSCNINNLKDYSIFFLFYTIFRATVLTVHFTGFVTKRISLLCSSQSLEIIFLLVISRLILKYKYYIHNIISLLSFCICNIIIDLITGSLLKLQAIDLAYSGVIISEVLFYYVMKYMLDNKYHKYWDLIFFQGVYLLLYTTISVLIRIKINGNTDFFINYFSKDQIGPVLGIFFFNLVCTGIIQQILNVLIINYFSPNHMLIAYVINKIKKILFNNPESDITRFYCLIPFVFQMISLLFFVEVLECNFCNLNKNTKRNIRARENEEMFERKTTFNEIELSDGIVIKKEDFETELANKFSPEFGKESFNDRSKSLME